MAKGKKTFCVPFVFFAPLWFNRTVRLFYYDVKGDHLDKVYELVYYLINTLIHRYGGARR